MRWYQIMFVFLVVSSLLFSSLLGQIFDLKMGPMLGLVALNIFLLILCINSFDN